ncbi:MBL fold metallo-hydrolase [Amycolatopsis acidiphila]|uniref:MBL fold metallo-hydrolase n=1 Tax=Amycolatopsis acidiphila TaxID=715473 RepID=A0A558AN47_9PSEU|nr:MBL fold metallo-hydrolase [Amycolatopsis acidiphila]TVT25651.1 MBL fold metallo-hydrolase [Amycolatopsis acidiphila]UIJ60407.1 MBL fold metallo-hydrolase [Amycolatopsis acidiphila]GHG90359.1 hypothetical protein GCM10017788_65610 [Amycolatopsis acidiphila]
MKPVLAFDWHGTLVADVHRAAGATAAVLAKHGHAGLDIASFRAAFRLPLADFFTDMAVPPELIDETIELRNAEMARSAPVPSPGAAQLLRQARSAGWRTAVVTAAGARSLDRDLQYLGWTSLIDTIHSDVADKSVTLRELAETGPVTYVGDTEYDIAAATRACATAIAYTAGYRPASALLCAGPAATIDDFDALATLLAAPDYVKRHAPQLSVLFSTAGRSSGYLLHAPSGLVLIDCGPGVVSALDRAGQLPDIRAVVITHAHADHSLDVTAFAYAAQYPTPQYSRPTLLAPAHTLDLFDELDRLYRVPSIESLTSPIAHAFEAKALPMDGTTGIALLPGVPVFSYPARHAVPSAALRFQLPDAAVAFSSDTGPTDAVVAAATDSTVFVCEATYPDKPPARDEQGHLSAGQAGRLAERAGAETLLLAHMTNPANSLATIEQARRFYDNSLAVATTGTTLSLST